MRNQKRVAFLGLAAASLLALKSFILPALPEHGVLAPALAPTVTSPSIRLAGGLASDDSPRSDKVGKLGGKKAEVKGIVGSVQRALAFTADSKHDKLLAELDQNLTKLEMRRADESKRRAISRLNVLQLGLVVAVSELTDIIVGAEGSVEGKPRVRSTGGTSSGRDHELLRRRAEAMRKALVKRGRELRTPARNARDAREPALRITQPVAVGGVVWLGGPPRGLKGAEVRTLGMQVGRSVTVRSGGVQGAVGGKIRGATDGYGIGGVSIWG
eukprot:Hpha_TRINITY_DN71_c0_g1::TRINITY_DN71_c0_g1_i1::g.110200::m.110200